MPSKLTKMTTDHDEIRRWAEERGAAPAEVERTERDGETGMIRLDFPGYSGEGSLKHISWEEWFDKFDSSGLALVYQEHTARGQKSNFNKLIGRETADARARGENRASRRRLRGHGGSTRAEGRSRTTARARRGTASSRSRRGSARSRRGERGGEARSGARRRSSQPTRRKAEGTREAPRAVAARLTGRVRIIPDEGATTKSRRRSGGRGRSQGSKGTRRSSSSRSSRRSSGRGRRR